MTRISSIYGMANADPPSGAEADHRNAVAYQTAWQRHGLAVIDPSTIADDWLAQAITNEANLRYGKRAGK